MKRILVCTGLAFSLSFLGGCAQHDPNSPDTSGSVPNNQPNVGVDTVASGATTGQPNNNNDGTNNNQTVNTGDSTKQR